MFSRDPGRIAVFRGIIPAPGSLQGFYPGLQIMRLLTERIDVLFLGHYSRGETHIPATGSARSLLCFC